jgi:hypothetical protein
MAQASCCYLRAVWRLSESAGMMDVGGWSWCVCVVIARRSECRDLSKQQYHGTSILSPKLAAALPAAAATKHELGRFLSATLRPPAFTSPKGPRMTTTITSRSCTMTVVLHHANSHASHLLQPFHFFTDVLAGWQPLDIASSVAWCAFCIVRCETRRPNHPCIVCLRRTSIQAPYHVGHMGVPGNSGRSRHGIVASH